MNVTVKAGRFGITFFQAKAWEKSLGSMQDGFDTKTRNSNPKHDVF